MRKLKLQNEKDGEKKFFWMKYQSSERLAGDYTKATSLLNFKELGNNILFLLKNDFLQAEAKEIRNFLLSVVAFM